MQLGIEAIAENGKPGAVVSTASVDGIVGDSEFFAYCATKAAVQAMTRCAALYCGEKGYDIRVNAVAPGYILTPMAEEDARQNGQTIEEYCSEFAAHHPIGRMGTRWKSLKLISIWRQMRRLSSPVTTLVSDGGYTIK